MKGILFLIFTFVCTLTAAEEDKDGVMLQRLTATENLVQDLLHEVNDLKSRDKVRQNKVAYLEKQLRLQRQHSFNLDKMIKKLKSCNKNEDSDLAKVSEVETSVKSTVERDQGDFKNRIRRQNVESPIAFFAKMDAHLEHAGIHQTVVFDVVVTNIGNAYNKHVGVFVAPVAGTYVFSTTLVSRHFASAHAQFAVNGTAITNMYVSGGNSGSGDDTTSQTIVLQLQQGDDVAIQNLDSDKGFYGVSHSTFSGFLLYEGFSPSAIIGK